MRTQFIEQGNAKSGKTVVDIPADPYLGFLVRVRGTTVTGETLTLADIGDLRLERFGSQKQSNTFEFYHNRTDLKKGHPLAPTGSAASAEDVVAWMPMFYNNLPNVMDVHGKEEADLTLAFDKNALSTRFGDNDCTYEVYGVTEQSISEKYVLDVRTQNIQSNSDGRLSDTLDRQNIAGIYLEDPNDNVDQVQVETDGEMVWDNIDQDVLTIITNLTNRVETAGNSLGEINLVESGDLREAFNESTNIDITFNSAGTLYVTMFSIEESNKTQRSRKRVNQFLSKRESKVGNRPN